MAKMSYSILQLISEAPATAVEISELTGFPLGSVKTMLWELARDGLAKRVGLVANVVNGRNYKPHTLFCAAQAVQHG